MAEQQERENNRREYRNNDSRYNNQRREPKAEEPVQKTTTESRNIAVDLETNIQKSVSGIGDLDSKKNQIISDLNDVNGLLVEFYDNTLDNFGAQGITDVQGRAYSAANYSTPEEKLSAIYGIIHYNKDKNDEFNKAFSGTLSKIKEQREKLKQKSIKLLDDNKKLIEENKKLINEAKLDIADDKEQSQKLENEKFDEENRAASALEKQKYVEEQIEKLVEEVEALKGDQSDLNIEMDHAKEAESDVQPSGKKNSQSNYYNAKSKYIETIGRQIQQKENAIADFNIQLLQFKDDYAASINKAKLIEKQKRDLDAKVANKERNLATLESKNIELKQKLNASIEPLEQAFSKKVEGMYKNEQKLNYDKESTLNTDNNEKETTEETEKSKTEEEKVTKQNETSTPVGGLPVNVTEEELASNFIENFTTNSSASERRQILRGAGFKNMISAIESASSSDKRNLKYALLDMQVDLEDEIPTKDEFFDKMYAILDTNEIDIDEIYDTIFTKNKSGFIDFANFSKLDREQIRNMQKVLDRFEKLKEDGNLTIEKAQEFEKSFAQFVKLGALIENNGGSNSRLMRGFKRIFGGDMYNARRKLLSSLSGYSESTVKDLSEQSSKYNSFLSQLGKDVEDTPKYVDNRGNVGRTGRGLSQEVEDGRMNYR